jgi:drug/metabolite transporter (DMT)-like permease
MDLSYKIALVCAYIAVSAGLIRFNKFLVDDENNFPFPMALTTFHMMMTFLLCSFLYLAWPSKFTGMEQTKGREIDLYRMLLPIGALFSVALYTSNVAYKYSTVTFLQFMKEANVIVAFLISCAVGLQSMNRVRVAVVFWIILGSSGAVSGEVHFVLAGFIFQAVSQLAECSRTVMGELVLNGRDFRLDPFTYTMLSAPFCILMLGAGTVITWDKRIPTQAANCWFLLIPNACMAFVLQALVATIIKELSAVGFILTGIVKDITIVMISAIWFGEEVRIKQYLSFTLTLSGIFFWSYMTKEPDSPLVLWVYKSMGCQQEARKMNDKTALVGKEEESSRSV